MTTPQAELREQKPVCNCILSGYVQTTNYCNVHKGQGLDQTRNLNPTPEARFAMFHWHNEYAAQRGGSMDFYDRLSDSQKEYCARAVKEITDTERERIAHLLWQLDESDKSEEVWLSIISPVKTTKAPDAK